MRVVLSGLHYAPEPSGNAPYTTGVARGLAQRGHQVRVVTGVPHYPDWEVAPEYRRWRSTTTDGGVELVRLRHFVPRSPSQVKRALMEISFGARLVTDRAIRSFDPDVVVSVSPALLASAMTVGTQRYRRRRPALGLWVQDLYASGMQELHGASRTSAVIGNVEAKVVRAVDGVAVAHERFASRLVESAGVDPDRVRVIRNWTHISGAPEVVDRVRTRQRLGWGSEIVVLHAGNMGVKQGLTNVVEAARVADRRGADVRFVLLGGGNQEDALRTSARGVHRLQFLGSLEQGEFEAALSAADVLLVNERPGVTEMSVPSKLTSYFVSGRPVLAATALDSVTHREIHAAGAGVTVESGAPEALLDAALALAIDPAGAEAFGARGRAYAAAHLDEHAALDRFESWLETLIGARTP